MVLVPCDVSTTEFFLVWELKADLDMKKKSVSELRFDTRVPLTHTATINKAMTYSQK